MLFTLRITDTDAFFALEEALDQFVMNTEDIEDELHEKGTEGDEASLTMLRRLDAGRALLDRVTAVRCSLADGPVTP